MQLLIWKKIHLCMENFGNALQKITLLGYSATLLIYIPQLDLFNEESSFFQNIVYLK